MGHASLISRRNIEPRDEETTVCAMRVVTMTITCSVFSTVALFIISTRGR